MANIFDIIKSNDSRSDPGNQNEEIGIGSNAGLGNEPGSDARRAAERKAEDAGRKWRAKAEANGDLPREIGGPKGLEPTRYGDWEKAGRCSDF